MFSRSGGGGKATAMRADLDCSVVFIGIQHVNLVHWARGASGSGPRGDMKDG